MNYVDHLKTISLDGGALCFDFVNTVTNYRDEPVSYIQTEEEWLTWLIRVNLADEAIQFNKESFDLQTILEVRKTLYTIFINYIHKQTIPVSNVKKFNKYLGLVNRHIKIRVENDKFVEYLDYDKTQANNFLLPIIKSARDILISDHMRKVNECSNCGWIYLDKSKSQTRRWCNMKFCGNRIKTQKYYRKTSEKNKQ